ncbi:phosphotransacetylase family protein [Synechococcus sp. H70.2]|uniref:phosphotransacetylase family protein n=1 Tax=unclassified Synechococcus TaxID=2626047 RepID=UPI0039C13C63
MSKFLLIGSTEPYSGKSAAILGLGKHLQRQGVKVTYGKPIGSWAREDGSRGGMDPDMHFVAESLGLAINQMPPLLLQLDKEALLDHIQQFSRDQLAPTCSVAPLLEFAAESSADLILLEGPADLYEGELFGLSLARMAQALGAPVLLINRYHSPFAVEVLLFAHRQLGSHLAGVLLNDVPPDQMEPAETIVRPFLEAQGIPVLGILPSHRILRSISVGELARQLEAEVLCCPDRMDLMVENIAVGAMNVNSALKYFRKLEHKAVITGGDRTDIQLAALETSTLCLILTGKLPLDPRIQSRAEELEVPILSVDLDTFTTINRIERAFGRIRLHEEVKVRCIQELMSANFDFSRLYAHLGLTPSLVSAAGA